MPIRIYLRIGVFIVAALLSVFIASAWRAQRRDRTQLAQDLATTRQALAEATSRQQQRDADLQALLAKLESQKRTVTSPAQIVHELPVTLHLPVPLILSPSNLSNSAGTLGKLQTGTASANQWGPQTTPNNLQKEQVILPAQDLKPLYDYTVDCAECQARLTALKASLADEETKTAALSRERDNALRIARGGSIWRHVARTAKWFAVGAVAGAIAAKAVHR
jgi:hypothetical protein